MSKEMKINAAKEAINFVKDGMKLGLGTGSTVDEFLILLSKEIPSYGGDTQFINVWSAPLCP